MSDGRSNEYNNYLNNNFYCNLLEKMPAVVFVHEILYDGSTKRIYRAGDYEYVFGWARQELDARNSLDDFALDKDVPWRALVQKAVAVGQASHDWRMQQPDGSFRWIRTHLRVVPKGPHGQPIVVGYDMDVTAEHTAKDAAVLSARRASLGELAAGLAHEVNQPLTVMALAARNAIRLLEKRGEGAIEEAIERLQRIEAHAARSRDIVDHLRIFAREEDTQPQLHEFAVLAAIDVACALCAPMMRESGIQVEIDCPDPTVRVMGQPTAFEQVILNLLTNSRDAIVGSGREQGRIYVRVTADGASVEVTVLDNGGGIPEHVIPRLFESFFTTKPPGKGVGIGLSFAHEAVARMGGSLTAGNACEGALFRLTLPVAS